MNIASLRVILAVCCAVGLTACPARSQDTTGTSHELFTEVLSDYVDDGHVDYEQLCKDERLETYIKQLAATDPQAIADDKARLAFWINVYNAYTLKLICDNYPVESINKLHFGGLIIGTIFKKTAWDKEFVVINGETMTLNHVEHDIVRPEFKDPRAHFALVCASVSCPPLRPEAFEGSKLDYQLDDQARIFFAETNKNYFEVNIKKAHLSKILDWYESDFGSNREEVLLYVADYLPDKLSDQIKAAPQDWDVTYTDYDWGLND